MPRIVGRIGLSLGLANAGRGSVASVSDAMVCRAKCGEGCLPICVVRNADALEGFEPHLPPVIVIALKACEPPRKPLRGKRVAGGRYLCLAWLVATQ